MMAGPHVAGTSTRATRGLPSVSMLHTSHARGVPLHARRLARLPSHVIACTACIFALLFAFLLPQHTIAQETPQQTPSQEQPADQTQNTTVAQPTASPAASTPATVIPTHRLAQNVAVISIHGTINADGRTSPSMIAQTVERRIAIAEREGADAIVFEIDTEIASHDASARIAAMIRESSIKRTFAWVRTKALSNSAIIALACREIIVSKDAQLGGITTNDFRGGRVRRPEGMSLINRTHRLTQSVIDDARRVNESLGTYVRDEKLVVALALGDVPLWWARNPNTGEELALDATEMLMLFPNVPPAGPGIGAVVASPGLRLPQPQGTGTGAPHPDLPAGSMLIEMIANAYQGEPASLPSRRVLPQRNQLNQWQVVAKISAGDGPFVLNADQLANFSLAANRVPDSTGGFVAQPIDTEEQLKAFLGASKLGMLNPTISDSLMAGLTHPFTRMVLIGVFFAMMFVEMLKPGTVFGGVISAIALLLFIAPAMMMGLASWWEVIAILAGVVLLAIEVFVLPGFGIPGILGLLLMMGGLISTFLPQGKGMFNSGFVASGGLNDLLWITLLVIGVADTSVVLPHVAVVAGLFPRTTKQTLAERCADMFFLYAISIRSICVTNHNHTQHYIVCVKFSKVCHL